MSKKKTENLVVRIDEALKLKLAKLAKHRKKTQSELVRDLIKSATIGII